MINVLIVEDELAISRFLRTALEADGLRVHEAGTLQRGLIEAATRKPDLTILDLGLPDGDGIDFIREVRQWSQMPILVLSARTEEADKIAALDAGADDYLVKPFVLAELLARVRALARRSYGFENEAIEIRGLSLHLPTRRVTVSARHIDLTASEYALLETLMLRADRVITRRFLEERIFGNKENLSNALDVHMGNLRRKIGDGYVRTVRGVGYVIDTVAVQKVTT